MLVKFLKAYEAYAAGEVAKFEKAIADKLIELGHAIKHDPKAAA
jgi:hypothetical protein